jgi:hypothetical protein
LFLCSQGIPGEFLGKNLGKSSLIAKNFLCSQTSCNFGEVKKSNFRVGKSNFFSPSRGVPQIPHFLEEFSKREEVGEQRKSQLRSRRTS